MCEEDLVTEIQKDEAVGNIPFCIAANAGTTSFGSVDRIDRLAEIANANGFRTALDEKLDLTQHLWDELKNIDGIEVAPAPHRSVLAFRVNLQNDVEADNRMTKILVERVNSDRDLPISNTSNDEKIYARIAIMSARTTGAIVKELLTKIRRSLSKLP